MTNWYDPEPLLERFRQWLNETRSEAEGLAGDPVSSSEPGGVDSPAGAAIVDVVAALTALRHEVKLETKSTRGLQEQVEGVLRELSQAVTRFDSVQADEHKAARQAGEPLAQSLADLDEALERGRRAVEQARQQALDELRTHGPAELDMLYQSQSLWPRWKSRRFYQVIRRNWLENIARSHQGIWDGLQQGYQLVQNRLRRAMDSNNIKRLATVGQPVDPHTMTVVEVIEAREQSPGHVTEEVRPGYLWKGRLLRLAEVKAVRADSASQTSRSEDLS